MIKGIYNWFKGLSDAWRTVTILSGFVLAVSGATLAIDHFKTKIVNANEVIHYLKNAEVVRTKNEHIKDSIDTEKWHEIYIRLDNISDSLNDNYKNTKKVTNSFAVWAKDHSTTVNDFVNAVNGLEFTLVQPNKSMNPELKIRIEKKIK